jgi:error-prone DNA polymerase
MLAARAASPFVSLDDFLRRTSFNPAERRALAAVGALNEFAPHRRAALWQVEAAWSDDEALFKHHSDPELRIADRGLRTFPSGIGDCRLEILANPQKSDPEDPKLHASGMHNSQAQSRDPQLADPQFESSPLAPMTLAERLRADFAGLELTAGTHPMALIRPDLPDVFRAVDLPLVKDGERVTIAGSVICRQRPGTAKGFVFISLEDETGIANAIVVPQLFEARRLVITQEPALRITGKLQNLHGVIHVKAEKISALAQPALPAQASHDFH